MALSTGRGALALLGLALLGGCADPAPDGRCATGVDCPGERRCVDGRCVAPTPCAIDAECAARQICDDRLCRAQSCRDDGDCPGRRCFEGWCRPHGASACRDDGDCPGGRCEPATSTCLIDACPDGGCPAVSCAGDRSCPDEMYCADDAVCRLGCRIGAGACGDGRVCDPATRRCAHLGCAADADCPAGAWCADGACLPGCRIAPDDCPTGRCDRTTRRCGCGLDADCPPDAFCAGDGVCRPGCRIGGCAEGRCDLASRRCTPLDCARDADCGVGEVCLPPAGADGPTCGAPRGPGRAEAPCARDADCATGRCLRGRCLGLCAGDGDCPSGRCAVVDGLLACAPPPSPCAAAGDCAPPDACAVWSGDGPPRLACVPPVGPGGPGALCTDDADCRADACLDGRCWGPCAADADCPGACLPAMWFALDDRGSPEPEDDAAVGFSGCLDPAAGGGAPCAEAACPADEVCALWPSADRRRFDPRCFAPGGGGLGGQACRSDADCRARWCADGRCVAPCVDDADPACAPGAVCGEARVVVWSRPPPAGDVSAPARVCGAR